MPKRKKTEWVVSESGCFEVVSHKAERYPGFKVNGKRHQMSRYYYRELFGPIPEGMVIMHTCDNVKCINPEHLKLGTLSDNARDMHAKGRYKRTVFQRGSEAGRAKLNEEEVMKIKIRLKNGETTRKIAAEYGLGKSTIGAISNGENWKHVVLEN